MSHQHWPGISLSSCLCSGGHFMNTAEKIRLPDDCTVGYIIESVLGVPLTRSNLFHSHLENLQLVSRSEIHKQVRNSRLSFNIKQDSSICRAPEGVFSFCRVAHVSVITFLPDHPQLWDVWEQEQYYQFERGVFCGGGSIKVRDLSVFNDVTHISSTRLHLSDFTLFCLVQVQVCALSPVPRHPVVSSSGCLLGRPLLSHPRPPRASVSERLEGTSVWYLTARLLLLQWCAVFNSLTGLLCGPHRDYSFLSGSRNTPCSPWCWGRRAPAPGRKSLSTLRFAGNHLSFVMYMLLVNVCNSHRMYCHIFEPFCQLYMNFFFCLSF